MKAYLLRKANGDNAIFPFIDKSLLISYIKMRYPELYRYSIESNIQLRLAEFNISRNADCIRIVGFGADLTRSIYNFELNNIRNNGKRLILSVYEHYDKEYL